MYLRTLERGSKLLVTAVISICQCSHLGVLPAALSVFVPHCQIKIIEQGTLIQRFFSLQPRLNQINIIETSLFSNRSCPNPPNSVSTHSPKKKPNAGNESSNQLAAAILRLLYTPCFFSPFKILKPSSYFHFFW